MNQLDGSYIRVLSSASNAPGNVMMNTRKLLLLHSYNRFNNLGFRGLCNALGLTEVDAYDAICHLRAVMKIPEPGKADDPLTYHHESFGDFLHDFKRSGFSHNFHAEGYQLGICTSAKIIEEVCDDGIAGDEDTCVDSRGLMKGHCDNISLSWPGDERFRRTDEEIRIMLYRNAMEHACAMFFAYDDLQKSISCFHALTTRFTIPRKGFPFYQLRDCAFVGSTRLYTISNADAPDCQDRFCHELSSLGKLKQVPLWTFDYGAVCGDVELRFTTPISGNIEVSDPWNMSCQVSLIVLVIVENLLNLKQSSIQRTEYRFQRTGEDGQLRLKGIIKSARALKKMRVQTSPDFILLRVNSLMRNGFSAILSFRALLRAFTARDALHASL
jgi:hypothetical protein